ncbi:MFS transporter [Neiella sp. HB171785]|uniref:MFS transporter n=1 Tax=Neiella litorisoli TaxID=2771431 RepID=A0A8J6UFD2_9GAMM|nr:MFS transporter [Neiella litorisoli]MBD1390899.1 MFS transporter [Neiella litorisoli]
MTKQTLTACQYALIVTIGGFVFGLDAAIISGTIRYITAEFALSDMELGTVVSAPSLGAIFGLFLAGKMADLFGRKKTLIIIAVVYLISALGSAFATNFTVLLVARFIGGLAFISISVTSMYIGEVSPPQLRGKLVSFNQLMMVIGLSGAYFISYGLVQSVAPGETEIWGFAIWRVMFATEILPVIIWAGLLFTIAESPRWLLMYGQRAQAKQVIFSVNDPATAAAALADMEANLASHKSELVADKPLKLTFAPKYRKVLLLGIAIATAQGFTGMNAILFYAPVVFEQLGSGVHGAFEQTTYIGVCGFIFTLAAIFLVDKLGRRPLLLMGLAAILASHLLCWYGFSNASYVISQRTLDNVPVSMDASKLEPHTGKTFDSDIALKALLAETYEHKGAKLIEGYVIQSSVTMNATVILFGIFAFIGAFHFSIGPIMWVLISEISPNAIRSVAIPFFALTTSISSYLVQHLFPWQLNTIGAAGTFLMYGMFAAIPLLVVALFLPETKNKSIEDIEKTLVSEA